MKQLCAAINERRRHKQVDKEADSRNETEQWETWREWQRVEWV